MAIEKLVCSNCKGVLRWNPEDRTFTCENCGTKFQTDNEFTYRIIDEGKIREAEAKIEQERIKAKNAESERTWNIILLLVVSAICIFGVPLIPLILKLFNK